MKAAQISYNYDTDKTTVTLDKEFTTLPFIHQLDALRDAIADLQGIYDDTLQKFHKEQQERRGKIKIDSE
jgi:hypothetical protein